MTILLYETYERTIIWHVGGRYHLKIAPMYELPRTGTTTIVNLEKRFLFMLILLHIILPVF